MTNVNGKNNSAQIKDFVPAEIPAPIPAPKKGFNAAELRVNPATVRITRHKHAIVVKHPKGGEDIIRTRTGEEWEFYAYVFVSDRGMSLGDKTYIIHPEFKALFERRGTLKLAKFYVWTPHDTGGTFLTYIPEPNVYGEEPKAYTTRRECYELAKGKWICIFWNAEEGSFEHEEAEIDLGEPDWKTCPATIEEVITLAFKDKYVNCFEHPLLLRLRGTGKKQTVDEEEGE